MNTQNGNQPVDILLVENNPGDVRLMLEAFKDGKGNSRLHIAKDGVEALAFLHRQGSHQNAPIPGLILLDLNLPRKDGHQVLLEIKTDAGLKQIPVIMFTTSEADQDIFKAYDLHANCYITKPANLDQFLTIIRMIEEFWLAIVKLPGYN